MNAEGVTAPVETNNRRRDIDCTRLIPDCLATNGKIEGELHLRIAQSKTGKGYQVIVFDDALYSLDDLEANEATKFKLVDRRDFIDFPGFLKENGDCQGRLILSASFFEMTDYLVFLERIEVHPLFRRQHVATRFYQQLLEELRNQEYLFLVCNPISEDEEATFIHMGAHRYTEVKSEYTEIFQPVWSHLEEEVGDLLLTVTFLDAEDETKYLQRSAL